MTVPLLTFTPGSGVPVDLDRLIASRMLIQANSGGGKSRALRYLLEQTHGRVQHLIIDPEGEFATLREKFPYVLFGKDLDFPVHTRNAKLTCRRLMEIGASAVIDLYELKLDDRRAFVRLFLEELMHLPRTLWHPALVVIDEAHVFAPERGSGESQATESVIALATQGRKRGYALVAATQRLSKLHKDVAAELLNKLIGRTGLDVDLKRAGDELGMDKDARATLRTLAAGEFYAYGPAISNQVTLVRTGAVETTHPEAGKLSAPPPPAPAAVAGLLAQLRDIPQAAEEELRALDDFKRKNAALERELRHLRQSGNERIIEKFVVDEAAIERAVSVALREQRQGFDEALKKQRWADDRKQREHRLELRRMADGIITKIGEINDLPMPPAEIENTGESRAVVQVGNEKKGTGATRIPVSMAGRSSRAPASPVITAGDDAISGSQQKILNAMAFFSRIGKPCTRAQVAGYCGVSPSTGTFSNNLSRLRTLGLIVDTPNSGLTLTDAGHARTPYTDAPSLRELHDVWLSKISGSQQKMLNLLLHYHPEAISREELALGMGVQADTGTFSNNLSKLRTLGLLEDPERGIVRASDLLFPQGIT